MKTSAKLNTKGRLLIFTLKTKGNQIPTFKTFKQKLDQSLKQDEKMINQLGKLLKPLRKTYFKFKVTITKQDYIKHLKNSLNLDLKNGCQKDFLKTSRSYQYLYCF